MSDRLRCGLRNKQRYSTVSSLDNLDALAAPLRQAGMAQKGYGVKAEDYRKVGASLLWTLKEGLGGDCTQ